MATPLLKPGARVAVVSPSGVHDQTRLARGLERIREWGLEPVLGRHVEARFRYTAGTVAQRAEDLCWALTDPTIDAAWFTRGGFGTAHLLEAIPWEALDGRPVIGFSDATALFTAMAARGVSGAVHGPVLHSLADHPDERSLARLRRLLLEGGAEVLAGRQVAGPPVATEGPLVGGNLCVLASLAGTPFAPCADGSILLLEEIGERPYQVDRLLTQLARSGALDGVRGVALGEFIAPRHPADADIDMTEVLHDLLEPLGVPVVADLPIGHGAANAAVRLGARVRLDGEGLHVG